MMVANAMPMSAGGGGGEEDQGTGRPTTVGKVVAKLTIKLNSIQVVFPLIRLARPHMTIPI